MTDTPETTSATSKPAFTDKFIRHPVLAIVINLVLVLVGWRALVDLPVQQFPKLESAAILVNTVYVGASAETVRGFVTTPIERAVSSIGGVDYVNSESRAGLSAITVHLKLNHDSTTALAEITARIQEVRSILPPDVEAPSIDVQRTDRPYATFYMSFTSEDRSVAEITEWLSRTIQSEFATVEGVQKVTVEGGRQMALRIWMDTEKLAIYNLSPSHVHSALQRNNYLAAVGKMQNDLIEIDVLTNTDLRSAEEFKRLIVSESDGAIIRLSDVARVEMGAEETDLIAKYNTETGVYLAVWVQPHSNEIAVAHNLRDAIEELRPSVPSDIDMQLAYDGTSFIEDALREITKTLFETLLIVALVVFLFLGSFRTALVPLVAMPISILGAVAIMHTLGFSLNLLTVLAMVLSVGLVVDDAIVVVENIARHVHEGRSRSEAAIIGARELIGPIIAMTITLAAVYAPIGFQGGLTGMLFFEFAITLAVAVMVSGFVAVTLSPVMSAYLVQPYGREGWLARIMDRIFSWINRSYKKLLDGALSIRWAIVIAALLIMVAALPLYQQSRHELAPEEDQSHITFYIDASPDAAVETVNEGSFELINKVFEDLPEADNMWSLVGSWGGFGGVEMSDWKTRDRSTQEMYGEVYGMVSQIPSLRVFPRLDPPLPTSGAYDVELVLQSDASLEDILVLANEVVAKGMESGAFIYVDTDLKIDLPIARMVINREKVADLGLDLTQVGQEFGALLGGNYVNRFNYFEQSYKVIPQIDKEGRGDLQSLLDLKIKTPAGDMVSASTFTTIEYTVAPRTLNRFQQRNAVRINGAVAPGVTKTEGLAILEQIAFDVGGQRIAVDYAGESRQISHESSTLMVTLGFAIIMIYLVLTAQFRSFRDPLIVLLGSVPLAISGALVISYLDFTTINIYSQVGLITLVGLIAKNGILIVEFANTLQEQGHTKATAIRQAALTRLRPVLMTTASTVLGHMPLIFVFGPGAEARNSIGAVLLSGMLIGTVFTLFVVPVYYSIIAREHSSDKIMSIEEEPTSMEAEAT